MSNMYFELYLEKMDFNSGDFNSDIIHLKSYHVENIVLDQQKIDELHTKIIRAKGDWLNFHCIRADDNFIIEINLIFHSLDIGSYEEQIIQKVIFSIEEFVSSLDQNKRVIEIVDLEIIDAIIPEDGLILKAHEDGGWGVADDVTKFLALEGIEYKVIKHQQSRFDGGASGGYEDIILYIASSATSGITWDILKGLLTTKLGIKAEYLTTFMIDSYKFKRLRKTVADRIVENHRDLILTEFYKNEKEIILEFKVIGIIEKSITIICDPEYQIKELKRESK